MKVLGWSLLALVIAGLLVLIIVGVVDCMGSSPAETLAGRLVDCG